MKIFNEIRMTFSFLSRIPTGGNGDIRKISKYFPLVGYAAGGIYSAGLYFSNSTYMILAMMATEFFLFGLFHFDGLLDTFDGFFNQNPDKRLEIMSKGDTGPFAVFYGFIFLALLFYSLKISDYIFPLYAGVFSRFSMNILLSTSKPVKKTGLGALFFPYKFCNTIISFLITLPLILLNPELYLISLLISVICGIIMHFISEKQIKGYTGDVLGATVLITFLFILITLNILL